METTFDGLRMNIGGIMDLLLLEEKMETACLNTTYNSSIYFPPHFAIDDGMGISFPSGLCVHCFCELGGTGNCSGVGNE